ncbi:endonuclease domain-containing protein [Microbacterium sp. B2969]|uniref:Endonuclease domain-containing protein n=1 Tax=Microbacterium alkaliflavum TaxID=3248839 RepID=A0ABW7Q5J6_9MICO
MDVVELVKSYGGVVLSSTLTARHVRPHLVEKAVAEGNVVRLRRRWVALPDADPLLRSAARTGVLLSCVTQAKRRGLWVLPKDEPAHVAARPHAGRVSVAASTVVHWRHPVVPRSPDALEDQIENVLALVALCQPQETALAIWESALRQGLVDPAAMRLLPLPAEAQMLLDIANPFADSGLETIVGPRLRWLGLRIVSQAWILGHRVDFLIGDRLVLQIDGGHHVGPQRTSDITHDAQLMLGGYHVIRVGYHQVINDWPGVQALITGAIARGLHRAA